jgi:hypothetical protein
VPYLMAATCSYHRRGTAVDARFAGKSPAPSQTCAKQVWQVRDEFAAGDVLVTIEGLESVLAHHRRALAARDELPGRVSATTLAAALEPGARVGPA